MFFFWGGGHEIITGWLLCPNVVPQSCVDREIVTIISKHSIHVSIPTLSLVVRGQIWLWLTDSDNKTKRTRELCLAHWQQPGRGALCCANMLHFPLGHTLLYHQMNDANDHLAESKHRLIAHCAVSNIPSCIKVTFRTRLTLFKKWMECGCASSFTPLKVRICSWWQYYPNVWFHCLM